MPFCGAAATDAVAVPCGLSTGVAGERGDVRVARPLGVGEVGGGVDERDQRALPASPAAAPATGRRPSCASRWAGRRAGRPGRACSGLRRTLAWA